MTMPRVYVGTTVTLSTTPQSIAALIKAIYPLSNDQVCSELHIKADAANSAVNVLVGDVNMTTALHEESLAASAKVTYGPFSTNSVPLANIFLRGVTGTPKVNIGFVTV